MAKIPPLLRIHTEPEPARTEETPQGDKSQVTGTRPGVENVTLNHFATKHWRAALSVPLRDLHLKSDQRRPKAMGSEAGTGYMYRGFQAMPVSQLAAHPLST